MKQRGGAPSDTRVAMGPPPLCPTGAQAYVCVRVIEAMPSEASPL